MIRVCYFEIKDEAAGKKLTDFLRDLAGMKFMADTLYVSYQDVKEISSQTLEDFTR